MTAGARTADEPLAAAVAAALAGPGGDVAFLSVPGLRAPSRHLTAAEVHAIREALLGGDPLVRGAGARDGQETVGYVCAGRPVAGVRPLGQGTGTLSPGPPLAGPFSPVPPAVVAAADHAGLTWDSPLRGPNDERIGPRFPRIDGVYVPDIVLERLGSDLGVTISVATVAGVRDDGSLTTWEREMADVLGVGVASVELVPVAVIAAHLGLRLAAAVILQSQEEEGDVLWSTTT